MVIDNNTTLLLIETATTNCSVALVCGNETILDIRGGREYNHAATIGGFVQKALNAEREHSLRLDAVAISGGPGSYTGLRIGTALAKGVCMARRVPLLAIPTLEVLCATAMRLQQLPSNARLCPMIDARRMEVYTSLYSASEIEPLSPITAEIIDQPDYWQRQSLAPSTESPIYYFGNGAGKLQELLAHEDVHYIDGITPLAADMASLALKRFDAQQWKDPAYYEPHYLKEFVATKPKNKVLQL